MKRGNDRPLLGGGFNLFSFRNTVHTLHTLHSGAPFAGYLTLFWLMLRLGSGSPLSGDAPFHALSARLMAEPKGGDGGARTCTRHIPTHLNFFSSAQSESKHLCAVFLSQVLSAFWAMVPGSPVFWGALKKRRQPHKTQGLPDCKLKTKWRHNWRQPRTRQLLASAKLFLVSSFRFPVRSLPFFKASQTLPKGHSNP